MRETSIQSNGFMLVLPVLLWNICFYKDFPADLRPHNSNTGLEAWLGGAENFSRIALLACTWWMPWSLRSPIQLVGLGLYLCGLVLYFGSWLLLMRDWRTDEGIHAAIRMAPSYTPLLWLTGIGLLAHAPNRRNQRVRILYFLLAAVFLICHNIPFGQLP